MSNVNSSQLIGPKNWFSLKRKVKSLFLQPETAIKRETQGSGVNSEVDSITATKATHDVVAALDALNHNINIEFMDSGIDSGLGW